MTHILARWALIALIAPLSGCGSGASSGASPASGAPFSENWEEFSAGTHWTDSSTHGNWLDQYSGYGTVGITLTSSNVLDLSPKASTTSVETHSALVTSSVNFGNLDFSSDLTTVAQLRTGSAPNTWERAWTLWHYTDATHFYYFIPKSNGWELGKEDPAYTGNQRFLATGSSPTFAVGSTVTVRVVQVGAAMTVFVNGTQITSFTDNERPYTSGTIGLYTEDAHVQFDNVLVRAP